jgi:hypothetical protein
MITNAYDMLDLLRDNVGEAVAAQWSDLNLLRRLNLAYASVVRMVSESSGQWLVKSTSLTAVDSVLTLPFDCAKPIYIEDSDGNPVSWLNSVAQRSMSRQAASGLSTFQGTEAYPLKNTIEVNTSGNTGTFTLWYQQRYIELHAGTAAAGGVASLTLQASRRADKRNDYYNGAEIEVISGNSPGRYTISDFVGSTRVLTLATTSTFSTDNYGIVPITPPECNNLIVLEATLLALAKPSSTLSENVLQLYINLEKLERKEVKAWLESRIIENTGVTIGEYL